MDSDKQGKPITSTRKRIVFLVGITVLGVLIAVRYFPRPSHEESFAEASVKAVQGQRPTAPAPLTSGVELIQFLGPSFRPLRNLFPNPAQTPLIGWRCSAGGFTGSCLQTQIDGHEIGIFVTEEKRYHHSHYVVEVLGLRVIQLWRAGRWIAVVTPAAVDEASLARLYAEGI